MVAANLVDRVVDVLQVPVVDKRHHDLEAVPFARVFERIVAPLPSADLLLLLAVPLEADVLHRAIARHIVRAAAEVLHVLDFEHREEIVFIRKVADGPDQTRGRGFRSRFVAHFHRPLDAIRIDDIELGVGAAGVFLIELERRLRLMGFAAGSVDEIAGANVGGVPPQHGGALRGIFFGVPGWSSRRGKQQSEHSCGGQGNDPVHFLHVFPFLAAALCGRAGWMRFGFRASPLTVRMTLRYQRVLSRVTRGRY
jgi:hypothetical protein